MPEIREYENKANLTARLDPSAQVRVGNAQAEASQASARAWDSLGGVASELGKQYEEHRAKEEISAGFKLEAEVNDNLSTAWNNYLKNADPNDPQTADRFRKEELEPILQSYASGFKTDRGKAWSEARVAALRSHYFEKTIGDQSRLAGVAAVTNLTETQNLWQATLQRDPSQLSLMLSTADSMIDATLASNPNWDASQIAAFRGQMLPKIRSDLTMAAGTQQALSNPAAFKQALTGGWGGKDIDADQREALYARAEAAEKADAADQRAAEAKAKADALALGDRNLTSIYAAGYDPETGNWNVPPDAQKALLSDMVTNPQRYSPGETASFIGALNRATDDQISGKNRRTDPNTYELLTKKIGKGLKKVEVDQAYAGGFLSKDDWTFLRTSGEGADGSSEDGKIPGWTRLNEQIEEFASAQRSSITKSNPMSAETYPLQDQRFGEFKNQLRRSIIGAVKGGLTADEAADRYLNPSSPNYFGKLTQFYQVTQDQIDAAVFREDGSPLVGLPPVDLRAIGRAGGKNGPPAASIEEYERIKEGR